MNRRRFLELTGVAAAAGVGVTVLGGSPAGAETVTTMTGSDLTGWEVALGDGLWAAAGQTPPNVGDITTDHHSTYSELRANISQRGVMAHNITFRRDINPAHLSTVHAVSFDFSMPYVPSPSAWPDNAQTVEGGFFVWDGPASRLDYGLAFQWVLNPWMSSFGDIRTWSNIDGGRWVTSGHLNPDTEWHRSEFILDSAAGTCALLIDGAQIPAAFTANPKSGWGTEVAARLQTEVISLWPGDNPNPPSHRARFRNWSWSCIPHSVVTDAINEGEVQS